LYSVKTREDAVHCPQLSLGSETHFRWERKALCTLWNDSHIRGYLYTARCGVHLFFLLHPHAETACTHRGYACGLCGIPVSIAVA